MYDVTVHLDGSHAEVWRGEEGETQVKIMELDGIGLLEGDYIGGASEGVLCSFDDISVALADDPSQVTYAHTVANELTKMVSDGAQTALTYDDWGRMSTTTAFAVVTDYNYQYGDKLAVISMGGVQAAVYNYDGMGKRRNKDVGGARTWYRYDLGWNMVAEYTDADTDWVVENRTGGYVYTPGGQVGMALARNVGADLDSGVYSYFTQDHLGSTRGLWDGDKLRLAKLNYAPYGEHDAVFGDAPDLQFTGKTWDSEIGLYYFPYRMYSPTFKRWLTRDPLGMVDGPNVYAYVRGNPIRMIDALGGYEGEGEAWSQVIVAGILGGALIGSMVVKTGAGVSLVALLGWFGIFMLLGILIAIVAYEMWMIVANLAPLFLNLRENQEEILNQLEVSENDLESKLNRRADEFVVDWGGNADDVEIDLDLFILFNDGTAWGRNCI